MSILTLIKEYPSYSELDKQQRQIFDAWWKEWNRLAAEINWPEGDRDFFIEHWMDEMSPRESLYLELSYASDDCE